MIYSEYFIHPNDALALNTLQSIPAFPMLSKKFSEIFGERAKKLNNLSSKLRISERQLPDIYKILPPICEKLEIPVPELYLEQNPVINAYTFGETTPCIVLHSGLLNNCSPDVIKAVIAHECGHIVCHHTVYKFMTKFFLDVGFSLINIPFLSFALKYALLYWDRCSEYSADRVAAFVCDGAESVVKTMTELSCGLPSALDKIDREEFLRQAEDYHSFSSDSGWNKFLMYYELIHTDHPFVVDRAADIIKWCDSKDYDNLCKGIPYVNPGTSTLCCPKCHTVIEEDSSFCSTCGIKIVRCPECGAIYTENDKFCQICGSKLF